MYIYYIYTYIICSGLIDEMGKESSKDGRFSILMV